MNIMVIIIKSTHLPFNFVVVVDVGMKTGAGCTISSPSLSSSPFSVNDTGTYVRLLFKLTIFDSLSIIFDFDKKFVSVCG